MRRKTADNLRAERSSEDLQADYDWATRTLQRLRWLGAILAASVLAFAAYWIYHFLTLPYDPLRDKLSGE